MTGAIKIFQNNACWPVVPTRNCPPASHVKCQGLKLIPPGQETDTDEVILT